MVAKAATPGPPPPAIRAACESSPAVCPESACTPAMAIIAIGPVPPTTVFTEPPISCFWLPETSTARLPPTEATSCRSMRLVRSFKTRVVWSFWAENGSRGSESVSAG
ncbi:hypothetical protein D3C80_1382040 [compost metagenome]